MTIVFTHEQIGCRLLTAANDTTVRPYAPHLDGAVFHRVGHAWKEVRCIMLGNNDVHMISYWTGSEWRIEYIRGFDSLVVKTTDQ